MPGESQTGVEASSRAGLWIARLLLGAAAVGLVLLLVLDLSKTEPKSGHYWISGLLGLTGIAAVGFGWMFLETVALDAPLRVESNWGGLGSGLGGWSVSTGLAYLLASTFFAILFTITGLTVVTKSDNNPAPKSEASTVKSEVTLTLAIPGLTPSTLEVIRKIVAPDRPPVSMNPSACSSAASNTVATPSGIPTERCSCDSARAPQCCGGGEARCTTMANGGKHHKKTPPSKTSVCGAEHESKADVSKVPVSASH